MTIVRPALLLAPRTYLRDVRGRLRNEGVHTAVQRRDPAALFEWIVRLLDRQGISNAAAVAFAERHGTARWADVEGALRERPICSKLRTYWHFAGCGYRKDARSLPNLDLLPLCALPRLPARKASLSQAAVSLYLFIRDVCGGDLVGWIDWRLAAEDPGPGAEDRAALMQAAVLNPLVNIAGTGPKVWSMILAELLLGADTERERWVTSGASFIAIASLVHAFLHRTGILRRLHAEYVYGPLCYDAGGCANIIAGIAARIDARDFSPDFPIRFPRWIQFAMWWFCSADGWSICNSNKIDDRVGCRQSFCLCYQHCSHRR